MAASARFCKCEDPMENVHCNCGEDLDVHEWNWEIEPNNKQVRLSNNNREVHFHPGYSSGTAAVRGSIPCVVGRHYLWEIKMLSSVYGTDVMVGVGTSNVNLMTHSEEFVAFLGKDSESWGYSYKGDTKHNGTRQDYGLPFGKGSIVGVHLDMWSGTLEFYLNRKPLGVAFRVARNRPLFPMLCSTVGNSAMRLVSSMSWPVSLELLCLRSMSSVPALADIPGLKAVWGKSLWWLRATESETSEEPMVEESRELELEIVASDDEDHNIPLFKPYKSRQRAKKRGHLSNQPSFRHSRGWKSQEAFA